MLQLRFGVMLRSWFPSSGVSFWIIDDESRASAILADGRCIDVILDGRYGRWFLQNGVE